MTTSYEREIVEKTFGQIRSFLSDIETGSRNYRSLANFTEQVEHQYRGRFLLELLQNAHDALGAPGEYGGPRRILVRLEGEWGAHGRLIVANTGRPLRSEDFRGLSSIAQSAKKPGESIGHKGLGFRSVLEITDSPEVHSRASADVPRFDGYCFRMGPGLLEEWGASLATIDGMTTEVSVAIAHVVKVVDPALVSSVHAACVAHGLRVSDEVRTLSPYLFPAPVLPSPDLEDLAREGYSTAICLPLLSHDACEAVRVRMNEVSGDDLVFLDRLDEITLDQGGTPRRLARTSEYDEQGCLRVVVSHADASLEALRRWDCEIELDGELHGALLELPRPWHGLTQVTISLALPDEPATPRPGAVYIYFASEQRSGSAVRLHAPFFAEMSRRGVTPCRWNDLLFERLQRLALRVVEDLRSTRAPEDARMLVDLLAPNEASPTPWLTSLLEGLRGQPIMWTTAGDLVALGSARVLPSCVGKRVVEAEALRAHAAFAVLDPAFEVRPGALDRLAKVTGTRWEPTRAEMASTVERLAAVAARDAAFSRWSELYEDFSELVPDPTALDGKAVLLDSSGRLQLAGRSSDRTPQCFFPPRQGHPDATVEVPAELANRVAFLSSHVRLHESNGREQTGVRRYLDRLVEEYQLEAILQRVVLAAVANEAVGRFDERAELCRQVWSFAAGLISGARGTAASSGSLQRIRLPCRGGWYPARETFYGLGWPGTSGEDLELLSCELPNSTFASRILLSPEQPEWGGRAALVREIDFGVRDGLFPTPVQAWRGVFGPGGLVGLSAPAGYDGQVWRAYLRQLEFRAYYYTGEYQMKGVLALPGLVELEQLSALVRAAFSRLVIGTIERWPADWDRVEIDKTGGYSDWQNPGSPLSFALRSLSWIASDDGAESRRPAEVWHVPATRTRELRWQYEHLDVLSPALARLVESSAERAVRLRTLGLATFDLDMPTSSPRAVRALAAAVADARVQSRAVPIVRSHVKDAWHAFVPEPTSELPSEFVVEVSRNALATHVATDGDPVYLPSAGRSPALAALFSSLKIAVMDPTDGDRLIPAFRAAESAGVRSLQELTVEVLVGGAAWVPDRRAAALPQSRLSWLAPLVLAAAAHGATHAQGARTKAFEEALRTLRFVKLQECEGIELQLSGDHGGSAVVRVGAYLASTLEERWLLVSRDPQAGDSLEHLARPFAELLERRAVAELKLVLGGLPARREPTEGEVAQALARVDVSTEELHHIRARWGEDLGWLRERLPPVLALLEGPAVVGRTLLHSSEDGLLERLSRVVPGHMDEALLRSILAESPNDSVSGARLYAAFGDAFGLGRWNAALAAVGRERILYADSASRVRRHLDDATPVLRALAREACRRRDTLAWQDAEDALVNPDGLASVASSFWVATFATAMSLVSSALASLGFQVAVCDVADRADSCGDLVSRLAAVLPQVDFATDPYEARRANLEAVRAHSRVIVDWARGRGEGLPLNASTVVEHVGAKFLRESMLASWSDSEAFLLARDAAAELSSCPEVRRMLSAATRADLLVPASTSSAAATSPVGAPQPAAPVVKYQVLGSVYAPDDSELTDFHQHLLEHLADDVIPQMSLDPTATVPAAERRERRVGGRRKTFSARDSGRRLSKEEADLIGFLGEHLVYRALAARYGVGPSAWRSAYGGRAYPGNGGDDSLGYDFSLFVDGVTHRIEVKATQGDEPEVELPESEFEAARRCAHDPSVRYVIAHVLCVTTAPRIVLLANPFGSEAPALFNIRASAVRIRYSLPAGAAADE